MLKWLKDKPVNAQSIGFRLNLAIIFVIGFYLLTTVLGMRALLEQSNRFEELNNVHFARALAAAELSHDAEVIVVQALGSMLGIGRSPNEQSLDLTQLQEAYQNVRAEFQGVSAAEQKQLAHLDKLQAPYFENLAQLEQLLQRRQQQQALTQQLNMLLQMKTAELTDLLNAAPVQTLQFYPQANTLLTDSALLLSSQHRDQLDKLRVQIEHQTAQMKHVALPPTQQAWLGQVERLTLQLYHHRLAELSSQQALLDVAKATRDHARQLSDSSYFFFRALKANAANEAQEHKVQVNQTLLMMLLFSTVFLALAMLLITFVRQHIVQRLNQLNDVMHSHVAGEALPIPLQGKDEITAMGRAFSVFVEARRDAEQALQTSREETEQANGALRQLNQHLQALSRIDELTQVPNRRYFDQQLQREWRRARRNGRELALIMVDVDYFKTYNDLYGHQAGDRCLHQLAQCLLGCLRRETDFMARYGGEEFIILLPEHSIEMAKEMAVRLLETTLHAQIRHENSPKGIVTISMGVAAMEPEQSSLPDLLIRYADEALYRAKASGRGCIEVHLPEEQSIPDLFASDS